MPRWLVIHTKGDISVGVILNRRHAQLVNNGLDYLQNKPGLSWAKLSGPSSVGQAQWAKLSGPSSVGQSI